MGNHWQRRRCIGAATLVVSRHGDATVTEEHAGQSRWGREGCDNEKSHFASSMATIEGIRAAAKPWVHMGGKPVGPGGARCWGRATDDEHGRSLG
jgi:hypothetical protein